MSCPQPVYGIEILFSVAVPHHPRMCPTNITLHCTRVVNRKSGKVEIKDGLSSLLKMYLVEIMSALENHKETPREEWEM
jgi:hypothetical protein